MSLFAPVNPQKLQKLGEVKTGSKRKPKPPQSNGVSNDPQEPPHQHHNYYSHMRSTYIQGDNLSAMNRNAPGIAIKKYVNLGKASARHRAISSFLDKPTQYRPSVIETRARVKTQPQATGDFVQLKKDYMEKQPWTMQDPNRLLSTEKTRTAQYVD